MPEGHLIHYLANRINAELRPGPVTVTSPQGRFLASATQLDQHEISHAEAFGKHLFIDFAAPGPEHIVYIHLGLIGKLTFETADADWGQIRLHIARGEVAANLRGPQWCRLISETEFAQALAKIGEDPIREDADPNKVWAKVSKSKRSIGSLLMDQKRFAGVGNIYRAEVLFRQGISPTRPGHNLTRMEFDAIWEDLVQLMRAGVITARIDTVRPSHTPAAMGREPRKDDHGGEVYVYRRAGAACHVCNTPVAVTQAEGRNLFWCPNCQAN
ncbi:DNA glycosylase [Corynebacterium phocae]|uniref:DNA-(apurinic or apyrimidinic site) lyase n=1 Tax=Corynebacterium phocae TaxID=161895 RepID=A0A1L7D6B2_9CORY|nr:Fpg/Nei family DNA glycosylase [Corynebacterium phocae]APT93482.1 DNA glycosylase [Corynebacterium phocae]KAA8720562.1 Fpg/Nei family DNA glycosylase [Corynebacterium phocae]